MEDEDDGMRLQIIAGRVHNLGPPRSRAELLADARALGTHTKAEWREVTRRVKVCHYCDVKLTVFNSVQDHKVPIVRGGSDAIENLDHICWQCNTEKGLCTPDEWSYTGPRPRPYAVSPRNRLAGAR